MFSVERALEEVKKASAYADRIEFVQAGGGNASAKLESGEMVISGAEVWWAHEMVERLARGLGTPRYLCSQRVLELMTWEGELYRERIAAEER